MSRQLLNSSMIAFMYLSIVHDAFGDLNCSLMLSHENPTVQITAHLESGSIRVNPFDYSAGIQEQFLNRPLIAESTNAGSSFIRTEVGPFLIHKLKAFPLFEQYLIRDIYEHSINSELLKRSVEVLEPEMREKNIRTAEVLEALLIGAKPIYH